MSDPESEPTDDADTQNDSTGSPPTRGGEYHAPDRWIGDGSILDAELPADVRAGLGRILGVESVATLADWIAEIRQFTGGDAISINDLCHANAETGHWGEMGGDRYHFLCFYDAVILAALADRPVDIRTESPDGAVVTATAAGTGDLTVTPEEAVFSFGIDDGVEPPADGEPTPADIYAAVCPYVRAFPDPDAYEAWAERVSAATIGMPLRGATDVAAGLVE